MSSLDVRLNNPLNIRPGAPWEGLGSPAVVQTPNGAFCNFISPVFGFRAVFKNYITKADRGVDTIRKLITEWAPPGENDTEAYIASVAQKTGYKPDDVINLKTWDVASAVCYAQTIVESGQPFETNWKMVDMANGAYRAGIVDAPPPIAHKILTRVTGGGAALGGVATAAEPVVSSALSHPHSPGIQITLGVLAAILAAMAAYFGSKGSK